MSHVSVSPTNGNGPTQGQRKTLTRVGIRSPLLYRLSYTVRREQAVGTEDLKVTATCTSTRKDYVFTNVGREALTFEQT